jgi:hypothetical protein
MSDVIIKIVLCLASLGIAVWVYLRWSRKKNIWLLLALATAVLAAIAFWLSYVIGGYLAIMAGALIFLGLWTKRGSS